MRVVIWSIQIHCTMLSIARIGTHIRTDVFQLLWCRVIHLLTWGTNYAMLIY